MSELEDKATKLKPCPFCGCKEIHTSEKLHPLHIIACNQCEVQTNLYSSKEKAIKAWNQRINESDDG